MRIGNNVETEQRLPRAHRDEVVCVLELGVRLEKGEDDA